MNILTLECDRDEKDLLVAELHEAGTLGLIEEDLPEQRCRLQAFFDGDPPPRFAACKTSPAPERDWVEVARAQWQPLAVGARFFLAPAWRDDPTPAGRLRLEMPPGTASGTGLHPATQLALEGLEHCVRRGDSVLDLGTGSGVLAAGAKLLGAGRVIGCDIDEEAARAAREYCGRDVAVFAGSVRSLRSASLDVVVANIHAEGLSHLSGEIGRVLKRDGRAVLSGFTGDKPPRLAGLPPVALTLNRAEWVCWMV